MNELDKLMLTNKKRGRLCGCYVRPRRPCKECQNYHPEDERIAIANAVVVLGKADFLHPNYNRFMGTYVDQQAEIDALLLECRKVVGK